MNATPTAAAPWLRRIAIAVAASVLAWRIAALGMAEFYAGQAEREPAAAAAALAWQPNYPKALRVLAVQRESSDPAEAEALLARAYQGDTTDGRTLMRLAGLWRKQGQAERADQACELAERLFPADAPLRLLAAEYWRAAGNPQKTLRNWDLAMQINPAMAPPLFPALLNVAKNPVGLGMLRPIVAGLPSWWPPFFAYAAQNAAQVDTLRALYSLRKAAGQPLGLAELNTYLARMMREGLWAEAYIAWINALGPEQHQVLGYLFDGGFELTSFRGGFDWSATAAKSVQVSTNYTQLATGKKALHAVFHGAAVPSSIIEQTAFLLPGRYRFSGRVRPDALQVAAGLEWVLECAASGSRLAASERFVGSDTWRRFSLDFQVANEACAGVRLRLQPVGYLADGQETKGEIWFDDLAIDLADGEAGETPRNAPAGPKKPLRAEGEAWPRKTATTKAPARSGADSAADTPGTPRREPKTVPQGRLAEPGSPPPAPR